MTMAEAFDRVLRLADDGAGGGPSFEGERDLEAITLIRGFARLEGGTVLMRSDHSYRQSKRALDEIRRLRKLHNLSFTFNPGGGEINGHDGFRCQIHCCDDVEDLDKLKRALLQWALDKQ